jgi:hypothetical protein
MLRKTLALFVLSLVACEPDAPPPRAPARHAPTASTAATFAPPTDEEIKNAALAMRADGIAEERAQRAKMEAADAAVRARMAENARIAAADAARICATSRPSRVSKAKGFATAAKAWWAKVSKNRAWIDAKCKFVDTTGTHVTAVREGGGVTFRARRVGRLDALSCSGARPAGLTEDDVRDYLNDQASTQLDTLIEEQPTCREHDRSEGVDLSVALSDTAGIDRVLALP